MSKVFFNEKEHRYFNEAGEEFISTTTLLKKYEKPFPAKVIAKSCERIGQNPTHPNYPKYAGMTAAQIVKMWEDKGGKAAASGTEKHDWLEETIKECSLNPLKKRKAKGLMELNTIEDLDRKRGLIRTTKLRETLGKRFPPIFKYVEKLSREGFSFFPEIGVFNEENMTSGLVDLLALRGDQFLIIDWKTSVVSIRFDSGYFKKDPQGNITEEWVPTAEFMKPPVDKLAASTGNMYGLQIAIYDWMLRKQGLKPVKSNLLFQIQETEEGEVATKLTLPNFSRYASMVIKDYKGKK